MYFPLHLRASTVATLANEEHYEATTNAFIVLAQYLMHPNNPSLPKLNCLNH